MPTRDDTRATLDKTSESNFIASHIAYAICSARVRELRAGSE
jgi:hypothetical protein